ncbi:MAG: hypothetical protein ACI835_004000 [Planctomycetota bacterium]|jgi:hypothetical protein
MSTTAAPALRLFRAFPRVVRIMSPALAQSLRCRLGYADFGPVPVRIDALRRFPHAYLIRV